MSIGMTSAPNRPCNGNQSRRTVRRRTQTDTSTSRDNHRESTETDDGRLFIVVHEQIFGTSPVLVRVPNINYFRKAMQR